MHMVTMQYEQMLSTPALSPRSLVAKAMVHREQVGCWCGHPSYILPHRTHALLPQLQPEPAGKDNPVVLWFSYIKTVTTLKRRQTKIWVLIPLPPLLPLLSPLSSLSPLSLTLPPSLFLFLFQFWQRCYGGMKVLIGSLERSSSKYVISTFIILWRH